MVNIIVQGTRCRLYSRGWVFKRSQGLEPRAYLRLVSPWSAARHPGRVAPGLLTV
jgi:hypothetical protein